MVIDLGTSLVSVFFELALVALVVWGLWMACRPRATFVVQIREGVPRVTKGQMTRAFVHEVGEVCQRHAVRHGEVRGVADGRRIALTFSGNLPEPCRQQLRNIWNLSGWSSSPR
jgi:Protein of unknown function (DUF3634)